MRLVQIKLSGFKSFVDPASIHVPGQLVGIVGPNGCGKSNVIDAVRWVLGESRASALRGDSMQDVIFNGSVNRKPLARSAVELIFDNALGRAGGQWSRYAEISVKRVLQRDGESSYQINNQQVRRRDITDMFLGTGLGPRAYAIIEQGMISRVIEARPEELRVFLEEAAGVSRYKERRRETEHRLADTRENLARVNDIRQELGIQIEKLDVQARIATRYHELHGEMQLKQHLLWFMRRRDAAAERERHSAEIGRQTNALEAATAYLRGVESRIETARGVHYGAGDGLNAAQAALYASNAEVARHESELRHMEDLRQRLESRHVELGTQLSAWRSQRSQLTQALHMWAQRLVEARLRVARSQAALATESQRLPGTERAYRAAQDDLTEMRSQTMQAEGRCQLAQSNLGHLASMLATLAQRAERLEAESRALAQPDGTLLARAAESATQADRQIESVHLETLALQAECLEREQTRQEAAESVNTALREHSAAEAQLATLREVQESIAEDGELRDWLERHSLSRLPRLWQKLRIDAGWETAVESVLRERLHAHALAGAPDLANLAGEKPPAKTSLFVPAAGDAPPQMAGLQSLVSKVHAQDPSVGGALADWLGGVYLVDQAPSDEIRAGLTGGAVLVNRLGHQFTRHTLSLHAPDSADAGLLARQVEIEALEAGSGVFDTQLAQAREALESAERELSDRQSALEALRHRGADSQAASRDAHIELLKLQQQLERYREREAKIRLELAEIRREDETTRARRAELETELALAEQEIRAMRSRMEEVKRLHVAAEETLAEQRKRVQSAEREAQDAVYGERECASKISEIDNSVRLIDQQIERADVEIGKLSQDLAVDPIPEMRLALASAVESRIECEKMLSDARAAVEEAAAVLRALEQERLQIDSGINPVRERIGELRLKEQAASINHDQFAGQLRAAGADETILSTQAAQAPRPNALQSDITRLSQEISELGAVNLAALQELESSQERKGFLDAQCADLEEASQTLADAIRRIDRETRELLRETFASVNRHFGSLFPDLFGGGEARLIMTGEEILDAGIQVMAQPPGKRNSTIHLLSGGEKALTAIALVFSMFQLNPAPFCMLDEVDAPLDDSNTVRFCELVQKMSAQTQFLFISHNKITMEMAEQLIGVTMPESGVSRVVAVDIDAALRMREELAA
ncbi:MAG: chromosome segregation protein SMC [Betaproteobacteria bacterium]|nr:chromosome segregation protein SMC [Betaproteobacteria bacterium]